MNRVKPPTWGFSLSPYRSPRGPGWWGGVGWWVHDQLLKQPPTRLQGTLHDDQEFIIGRSPTMTDKGILQRFPTKISPFLNGMEEQTFQR